MHKINLSVVLITKNEGKILSRCLDAVSWADEIVIADSYSTDRTVEIAKAYGAGVYMKKWAGYSAQKNFAISKAKNNWILSLDADEIMTPGLKDEILKITGSPASAVRETGFFIPRRTYFYGCLMRFGKVYPDYQMRLFRKGSGSFEKTEIHERLIIDGEAGRLKTPLLHYSKADIGSHIDTVNSYTELEAKRAVKLGYRPTGYSVIIKPFLYFMKHYIWKFGFLDGLAGLVYYSINAAYVFVKEIKAMEAAGIGGIDLIGTIFKRAR